MARRRGKRAAPSKVKKVEEDLNQDYEGDDESRAEESRPQTPQVTEPSPEKDNTTKAKAKKVSKEEATKVSKEEATKVSMEEATESPSPDEDDPKEAVSKKDISHSIPNKSDEEGEFEVCVSIIFHIS